MQIRLPQCILSAGDRRAGSVHLHPAGYPAVYQDVSILELFAEDGVDAVSSVVYPETPYDRVSWKGDLSVELYEIDA